MISFCVEKNRRDAIFSAQRKRFRFVTLLHNERDGVEGSAVRIKRGGEDLEVAGEVEAEADADGDVSGGERREVVDDDAAKGGVELVAGPEDDGGLGVDR